MWLGLELRLRVRAQQHRLQPGEFEEGNLGFKWTAKAEVFEFGCRNTSSCNRGPRLRRDVRVPIAYRGRELKGRPTPAGGPALRS